MNKYVTTYQKKGYFRSVLTFINSSRLYSNRRGVAQLAAHRVWDAGVGGSSPPTPTIFFDYDLFPSNSGTNIQYQRVIIPNYQGNSCGYFVF